MPFFNNHVDGHLIVLLQLCRAKIVDSEVRISSSYTATKVLFNLDCQEFADFRNSFKATCSPLRSISLVSYGHSANNSQSPMVVSAIRDLYERAENHLKNEHIRNPAKPISVLSVIHNEELEAQYCPSMVDDHDELSRMVEEDADDLESDESESGDEAISPSVQANLKLKGVASDQDEVDTGAIKRCLLDQFSSSQNLKKSRPLLIKQEKN
nr:replication factor A protein 1-like isoform X2 [Ipomoea batatas]